MSKDWSKIPSDSVIAATVAGVESRGISVILVADRAEALAKVKSMIPAGAEIMTGSSITLDEIGLIRHLTSDEHGWNYLATKIGEETDIHKRSELRRQSDTAEYFLGSVNAIAQTGELVAADATGSRVGAYPFAAKKVVIVAGVNKIAADLAEAMLRVRDYVFSLENERANEAYGRGSIFGKWVIIERELNPERMTLILVKEELGY